MRYTSTEEAHKHHIENFKSDGYKTRKDAKNSRDFFRINFILLRVNPGTHVLDVGCNGGTVSIPLKERNKCRVKGIDIVPELIEKAKSRGIFAQVGIAESLPFTSNQFDHVVCTEVLEHLYEPEKAIAEAYRVLKPGGSYIVTIPTPSEDEELGDYHHQNFTVKSIEKLIKSVFVDSKYTAFGIAAGELYCVMNNVDKDKMQWLGIEVFKNA